MSKPPLILTVDDDPHLTALVELHVRQWGLRAASVHRGADVWPFLEDHGPEVVLMDVMLGDADGAELVARVKGEYPALQVITITQRQTVEAAVRCMKNGASDFITKPLDFDRLRTAVEEALEVGAVQRTSEGIAASSEFHSPPGMLGRSQAMVSFFQRMEPLAPTDVSVLILGETGTGKELTARALHDGSPRRDGPFVAVNAAAIPHDLVESMLFGHVKGAFTGAHHDHQGYCLQADGGTLFLDEIAEMGFEVQAKLLRFLQNHTVQPVGARTGRKVDVRVLAATHTSPQRMLEERILREDLYYRLRGVSLTLPPLRQRHGDIPLLAEEFLRQMAEKHGRGFRRLSPEALRALEACPWPGNVRQLRHCIEEAVILHRGETLEASMLPGDVFSTVGAPPLEASAPRLHAPRLPTRDMRHKDALIRALEATGGRPEAAAKHLGISRATVYRRIKKFGLEI